MCIWGYVRAVANYWGLIVDRRLPSRCAPLRSEYIMSPFRPICKTITHIRSGLRALACVRFSHRNGGAGRVVSTGMWFRLQFIEMCSYIAFAPWIKPLLCGYIGQPSTRFNHSKPTLGRINMLIRAHVSTRITLD